MKQDRITAIRHLLFTRGQMSIADLAVALGASEPTLRRDLVMLERDGTITRTHGGARIADIQSPEIAFESREHINLAAKRAIAEAAFAALRPRTSVFLDAGTTILQLARLIRLRPLPLQVFTNGLPIAQILMAAPQVSLTLLGGTLRSENASLVGPMAETALTGLWFDQLYLGAGAIGPDMMMSSADPQEARLNAMMLQRSETATILADSSKFGTRLTHGVVALDHGHRLIADAALPIAWQRNLRDKGVDLQLAGTI